MKKTLNSIIILLIFSTSVFAQKYVSESEIKVQRFGDEVLYKDTLSQPLDGHYKIAERSGAYKDAHFQQGKRVGKWLYFDSKNRKTKEINYKDGKSHGEYFSYHQNGKVRTEGTFVEGKEHDIWTTYDDQSRTQTIENYNHGKKEGKWYKRINGREIVEQYKNDQPVGHWEQKTDGQLDWEKDYQSEGTYIEKHYHYNGKLASKKEVKNHKLNGEQLTYAQTGTLLKKEVYIDDQIKSLEQYYDNGRLETTLKYKNGKPHGKFTDYHRNGSKSIEGEYDYGHKTGVWTTYVGEKERLYSITTYRDGVPNGKSTLYYPNGQIEKEGNYHNDSYDGIWRYYNDEGKLIKEEHYENGRKISSKKYE